MAVPRIVKEEKNPKVLRAFLEYTIDLVKSLDKENSELRLKASEQAQELLNLDDQLLLLRERMFGKSSEKRGGGRPRSRPQTSLTLHSQSLVPPPEEKELQELVKISVDHKLSPEELSQIAVQYGFPADSEWESLTGFYDESEEVDIQVESYVRKKHRRFKYRA